MPKWILRLWNENGTITIVQFVLFVIGFWMCCALSYSFLFSFVCAWIFTASALNRVLKRQIDTFVFKCQVVLWFNNSTSDTFFALKSVLLLNLIDFKFKLLVIDSIYICLENYKNHQNWIQSAMIVFWIFWTIWTQSKWKFDLKKKLLFY